MDLPIATLKEDTCKAEIYEADIPGQFTIRYLDSDDRVIAEESLSGVSTYRQREQEIRSRLNEVCKGRAIDSAALSDSGEY